MSTAIQEQFQVGQEPTHEERELIEWAEEAIRKEMANVAEGLRHIITITVALLGGTAALLGQLPMHAIFKVAAFTVLLLALAASLWGSIPRNYTMSAYYLETIGPSRKRAVRFKTRCLKGASALLLAAFAVLLAGLVCRMFAGG